MTDYFDDHRSISSHNSSFLLFDDDIFFEQRQKSEFDPCASFKMPSSPIPEANTVDHIDQLFNFSSFSPAMNVNFNSNSVIVKSEIFEEAKSEPKQEMNQMMATNLFSNFLHLINLQQIEDTTTGMVRSNSEGSCGDSVVESDAGFVFSSPSSPASSISSIAESTNCASNDQQNMKFEYSNPINEQNSEQVDYYKLWIQSQEEIKSLRQAINDVSKKIDQLEDQSLLNDNVSKPITVQQVQRKISPSEPPSLYLRVCSEFQRTWYTDRAFPSFTVGLFDSSTLQPYLDISGWRVVVSLIDGHGKDATSKFSGSSGPAPLSFAISRGRSVINGLRFSSVSSKNGGCFQLVMRVINPFASELPTPKPNDIEYLSEPIQILSYRLFHVPKLESDMLFPSDPLWKVKGIGPLYAKRFSELGISTIKDLASIDLESLSEDDVRNYVNSLRRDRGALTPAKLFDYVSQAREIVSRDGSKNNGMKCENAAERESESSISHPAKRVRM